jgi:hypothetical protein
MISFGFDFSPLSSEFKNFWNRSWSTPFRHKFVELELHTTDSIIGFNFLWNVHCDHAGLDIQMSVFGWCVHFNFYDNRHWNYQQCRPYNHGEEDMH